MLVGVVKREGLGLTLPRAAFSSCTRRSTGDCLVEDVIFWTSRVDHDHSRLVVCPDVQFDEGGFVVGVGCTRNEAFDDESCRFAQVVRPRGPRDVEDADLRLEIRRKIDRVVNDFSVVEVVLEVSAIVADRIDAKCSTFLKRPYTA